MNSRCQEAAPSRLRSEQAGVVAPWTNRSRTPPDRAAVAPQLIFNQRLDGWLTILFTAILWFVILDMSRVCLRRLSGMPVIKGSEASYQPTQLEGVPAMALQGAAQGSH